MKLTKDQQYALDLHRAASVIDGAALEEPMSGVVPAGEWAVSLQRVARYLRASARRFEEKTNGK
jgi:hypothetical protein